MDAISLSAKTARCANKRKVDRAKSGCRVDLVEPEKELSSRSARLRAHDPTTSALIAHTFFSQDARNTINRRDVAGL